MNFRKGVFIITAVILISGIGLTTFGDTNDGSYQVSSDRNQT
ncbi:hypothetical protein [Bacillus sp. YC2]|nr:hypothetical protein [Bacillus sp. YC2]